MVVVVANVVFVVVVVVAVVGVGVGVGVVVALYRCCCCYCCGCFLASLCRLTSPRRIHVESNPCPSPQSEKYLSSDAPTPLVARQVVPAKIPSSSKVLFRRAPAGVSLGIACSLVFIRNRRDC